MRLNSEDFDVLYEALDQIEQNPKHNKEAVEDVYKKIQMLHSVNQSLGGSLMIEPIMEEIRFKIFMEFNIVL